MSTFSVDKAQDLSIPNICKSQYVTAESSSSAGENPTAKEGFLADFSAEKVQYPSHIKSESTPQTGLNSLIADQANEPNFGGIPTQYGLRSRVHLTRWQSWFHGNIRRFQAFLHALLCVFLRYLPLLQAPHKDNQRFQLICSQNGLISRHSPAATPQLCKSASKTMTA